MARHWVGGTGVYSDNTNHWSATSGGAPGASKPGAGDDVFVDGNSDVGGAPFVLSLDENSAADTFDVNASLCQLDFVTYNFLCTAFDLLDGQGSGAKHLMGSGTISCYNSTSVIADTDWETSTYYLGGGSSSSMRISAVANTFYNLTIDSFTAATMRFEYEDTNTWIILGDFLVTGDATFDCTDADEADLLAMDITGNFTTDTGTTFTAAPTMNIEVGGDVSIHVSSTFTASTSTMDCVGSGMLLNATVGNAFYILKVAASTKTTQPFAACNARFVETGAGTLNFGFQTLYTGVGSVDTDKVLTVDAATTMLVSFGIGGFQIQPPATGISTIDGFDVGAQNMAFNISGGAGVGTVQLVTRNLNTGTGQVGIFTGGFDLNGFDLTCGTINLSGVGVTASFGAGAVACASVSSAAGNGTLNLETATVICAGNWDLKAGSTIVGGTSTVAFNGAAAQTVTSRGESFHNIIAANSHASGIIFADALNCTGTFTWDTTTSNVLTKFADTPAANVWTSVAQTGGNTATVRSSTPTTQFDVTLTNPATLTNMDVQDSNLSGANIDVTDPSNTDSGNNSANWVFVAGGDFFDTRGVGRGVGRGVARGVS